MDLTLSIETSNPAGGVALLEQGRPLAEFFLRGSQTHSRRLMMSCHFLLEHCGITFKDLSLVTVSLGPGSFTGLRIGLATAKGLAYALKIPLVGVSTLDAMASQVVACEGELICPVQHARFNEVYVALYRADGNGSAQRITPYKAVTPEEMSAMLPMERIWMLGDALDLHWEDILRVLGDRVRRVPAHLDASRASTVGCLGYEELRRLGRGHDLHSLTPFYVRPSEAEIKKRENDGKVARNSL